MEDLDWYINQAGDDVHLIEKYGSEDSYDLYEALELDALAAPGPPPVVKGAKKLDVSWLRLSRIVLFGYPAHSACVSNHCPCILCRR